MNQTGNYLFGASDTTPIQRAADELDPGWQFLLDPVAPPWPEEPVYFGQSSSATRSTFSSDIDESLWDCEMWEHWDLGNLNANPRSDAQSASGFALPDKILTTIGEGQLLSPISQISTEASRSFVPSISRDDYFVANSASSNPGAKRSVSSPLRSPSANAPNQRPPAAFPNSRSLSTMAQPSPTKAKPTSREAARSRPIAQRSCHRIHNNVERQYRARLNDEYTTLLNALPKELTSNSSTDNDKTLSKIEILDLARKHIYMLEKEEAQLKEEKTMVKGQIQLLKRLLDTMI
ncbi:hypothetical protein BDZ45DRAFT_68850 [Acephala macrosclerotiorum]|nr:hypothetical protein BDZ45DRAFT_68850 [Acephala macrosclerotiorum]